MASSRSPTLTALQERVLDAFRGEAGAYLTGGSALGHYYLGHRRSIDLDWFAPRRETLDALAGRLATWCDRSGCALTLQQSYPGFRRYLVRDGSDETLVDLVHEPVAQSVALDDKPVRDGIRIDALADLAANKIGAVLGRGETKDLVDLYFLAQDGHDPIAFLEAARLRDGGVEPATLAWVLASVPTDTRDLLMVRPLDADALARFRDDLIRRLQTLAWPG